MRAARNSCSKGNIDPGRSLVPETDKIKVYILRSKCGNKLHYWKFACVCPTTGQALQWYQKHFGFESTFTLAILGLSSEMRY